MFHNNKELRISLVLLGLATTILTLIGLSLSVAAGVLILISGLVAIGIHLSTEYYRYKKLQKEKWKHGFSVHLKPKSDAESLVPKVSVKSL